MICTIFITIRTLKVHTENAYATPRPPPTAPTRAVMAGADAATNTGALAAGAAAPATTNGAIGAPQLLF